MENNFKIIAENMRKSIGIKTLQDLAIALEISPQTLSSHKKSGRFPEKHIVKFSKKYAVPVEFLMTGEIPGVKEGVDKDIKRMGFGFPPDPIKKYILGLGFIIKWIGSADKNETIGENAKSLCAQLEGICVGLVDESNALVAKARESYGSNKKDEKIIALLEKENTRLEKENSEQAEKIRLLENKCKDK